MVNGQTEIKRYSKQQRSCNHAASPHSPEQFWPLIMVTHFKETEGWPCVQKALEPFGLNLYSCPKTLRHRGRIVVHAFLFRPPAKKLQRPKRSEHIEGIVVS